MEQEGALRQNAADLGLTVARELHRKTFRRVRNLRVDLIDAQVVVHGNTSSYYVKALALEAAREVRALICPIALLVDIRVD